MRRLFTAAAVLIVLVAAVVLVRTLTLSSRQLDVVPVAGMEVDESAAAARLGQALTYRTISHQNPAEFDPAPFVAFRHHLAQTYPGVHRVMQLQVVAGYSLLYTWQGSEPEEAPIILLAHSDVVPVDPGTEADWIQPPFSGAVADGFIWGRGAIDDKASLVAILEAVEALVGAGFRPRRSLYLAFGHDEEIGGDGARAMVELLRQRNVRALYILDEGRSISEGELPGIEGPVAQIGIAEKGYMTVELAVEQDGGHSSRPPATTGLGILGRAVSRLESNQRPAAIRGAVREMFATLAPEMPFSQRLSYANLWLFGARVKASMAQATTTNAMIRTTTATTMAQGSYKENILPARASMVVNFRLLPGETSAIILEHIRKTVADERVVVTVLGPIDEPSNVSTVDSEPFRALPRTVRQLFPDVLVPPALVLGATDSRHYRDLSANIYRFAPNRMKPGDGKRVHGTNERTGVATFADMIRFYAQLLRTTAG